MRHTCISLAAVVFAILTNADANEKTPEPLSVETDHGGDSSIVSSDEIVLKRSDGTTEFLTKNGFMERVPKLSHDDSTVAFLRRIDSNKDGAVNWDDDVELWLMRLANRSESRLVPTLTDPSQATWHPSKMQLAFIANNKEGKRGLYSYEVASKSLSLLVGNARSWPTWSPSGSKIAFYDKGNRVVVFNINEKKTKILSPDVGNSWALYWTKNDKLAFSQEALGWHVYNGGNKKPGPLDDATLKKMTFVDQGKFGWAAAETGDETDESDTVRDSKSEGDKIPKSESKKTSQ